ncbi:hypothetical protein [Amycolatopsis sp.]|uniref:hypothetical protein n=1 Tax=Amycolatopsis sp. TaxID=37632 RepID=UPI002CAC2E43|nr:hypothetical protein [Amycolatopsis sp.]HVV09549.1 hypothetical protein [Amycolatopsis sp.]
METWAWLWTELDTRTHSAREVLGSHTPHFSGGSARDHLVERLRFAAETEPRYRAVAELIANANPPLAAAMGNEVFCVAKVDHDRNPLSHGGFARKQDAAVGWAIKGRRRPRIW